jgi:hypothetical protein
MKTSITISGWGLRLNRLRLLHSAIILCHLLLKPFLTAREIALRLLPHGCQKPASVPHILRKVIKKSCNYFPFKINKLHIVIIKIQQIYLQILTPNVNFHSSTVNIYVIKFLFVQLMQT